MADVTTLCNDALGQLGQTQIDAITDGSHPANLCLIFYDSLRRSMIRDHRWNFAKSWQALSQDVEAPPIKWTYQYTTPANVLRVWAIDQYNLIPFEVIRGADEIKKVACNQAAVVAELTFDVTNPDQWDGMFYMVMSTALAWKLAPGVIGGDTGLKTARDKFIEVFGSPAQGINGLLKEAKAVDGQEESTLVLQSTSLTTDIRNG